MAKIELGPVALFTPHHQIPDGSLASAGSLLRGFELHAEGALSRDEFRQFGTGRKVGDTQAGAL
jgi:hypothetical protein